jgi:hypothetical protein
MRFLVIMSDNRPLETNQKKADCNSLVAAINANYCNTNGYEFIYYRPYLNEDSQTSVYNCVDPNSADLRYYLWSKVLSLSLATKLDYDYVVYIDSSVIFNSKRTLDDFVANHASNDIILLNDLPVNAETPSSKFVVLKVSDTISQFLYAWYNVNATNNKDQFGEQLALASIYKNYNVALVDNMMYDDGDLQFLKNITENTVAKSYIRDNNITYTKNIININLNEFTTENFVLVAPAPAPVVQTPTPTPTPTPPSEQTPVALPEPVMVVPPPAPAPAPPPPAPPVQVQHLPAHKSARRLQIEAANARVARLNQRPNAQRS